MSDTVNLLAFGTDVVGSADTSGSGSGGHTIENPSGTDMEQRSNLQFTDAVVADDSTNDRTEISIVRELMQAEFDELTPEEQNRGVIVIKDANPVYLPSDNAVSVTSDGVKTYSQLLDELYALADQAKISKDSCLAINKEYHRLTDLRGIDYSFAGLNGQSLLIVRVKLRASNSAYEILSPNYSNASTAVPTTGTTITLYYNIISTGLDAEIPAENVIYGDSNVKDALDDMFTEMTFSVNETIQTTEPTNKNIGACPSGYTPLSVYWVRSGGGNVFSVSCYLWSGNVIVTIANEYTSAATFQGTLHVILRKTN